MAQKIEHQMSRMNSQARQTKTVTSTQASQTSDDTQTHSSHTALETQVQMSQIVVVTHDQARHTHVDTHAHNRQKMAKGPQLEQVLVQTSSQRSHRRSVSV